MRAIYRQMEKLAPTDVKTLIQGENGTGKGLIAHALHLSGPRSRQPFVTLDCSTIPDGLIESHLFGHVRGAFTGAVATRRGVFAEAHRGTLFIDEVTELRPHMQARLLRVIESGEFTMVGANQPQRVDVRILTATNQDLPRAVADARFREDLYFRMSVARVELPPLRERCEDVPLLATHFLEACLTRYRQQGSRGLTARAMEALTSYAWPGNVRQLGNWIESAVILAERERIDVEHFPGLGVQSLAPPAALVPSGLTLPELERLYIVDTLRRTGGNRTKTAVALGISVRSLHYRLRDYGMNRTSVKAAENGPVPVPSLSRSSRAE
jgi:DNA-binding NtrC family response regulator